MTIPLYIFDLDGTLADLTHRRPLVELQNGSPVTVDGTLALYRGRSTHTAEDVWVEFPDTGKWAYHSSNVKFKKNWDAFHAACVDDKPIIPVISAATALGMADAEIWIWSGRSDAVRAQTEAWIQHYLIPYEHLTMRPAGDYTPDDQLKESWLHAMSPEDRARLVMTFDDRDRVVAMWRRNGVVCAQVAPGDF
jgi:phosphoglycolate phosphatase-like HAD superfamily hydrolase